MKKPLESKKKILTALSFLFFGLMILVALFNEDGVQAVYKFDQEIQTLKAENHALKRSKEKMKQDIDALKTEPLAIEKIAREKLHLVKPNETIYKIVR